MRHYFEKMDDLGKPLRPVQKERMKENVAQVEAIMKEIDAEEEPPLFKVSDTHYAATWLLDPRAPAIAPPAVIQKSARAGGV